MKMEKKICEHCKNQSMCKVKYFRDLLISNSSGFVDVRMVMEALVKACDKYDELV